MRVLKKELWPSRIRIAKDECDDAHYDIETWLGENMGAFKDRWNTVPFGSQGVHYYFRNERDATMFALRWS
jgi:hypothetical protein